MNAVDDGQSGAASGINNMMARMSNLFGVAGLGAVVAYLYRLVVLRGGLEPPVDELMLDAGFGERLTGPLYQVSLENLQAVAMNHAMIALCLLMAEMALVAALIGWLTQS
jgi:hypothetical protein